MLTLSEKLEGLPALNQVVVPDLWQQQAVTALRQGQDVVVQAPTGAGKTLIFELWSSNNPAGKPQVGCSMKPGSQGILCIVELRSWRRVHYTYPP